MVAVKKVVEARSMSRVRRGAGEPRLFEVEDPGGAKRLDEAGHYSR